MKEFFEHMRTLKILQLELEVFIFLVLAIFVWWWLIYVSIINKKNLNFKIYERIIFILFGIFLLYWWIRQFYENYILILD